MVSMTELTECTKLSQKESDTLILIILFILSKNLPAFAALPDFRRFVTMPAIVTRLPPVDFSRPPINAVTVHDRTRLGVSTAFGVVLFAKGKQIGRASCRERVWI